MTRREWFQQLAGMGCAVAVPTSAVPSELQRLTPMEMERLANALRGEVVRRVTSPQTESLPMFRARAHEDGDEASRLNV